MTPELLDRAAAVLHPDDMPVLASLQSAPDAHFVFTRPLVEPEPEQLRPMYDSIADTLRADRHFPIWYRAGVVPPENYGATYYNTELQGSSRQAKAQAIGNYAFAAALAASLPESAAVLVESIVQNAIAQDRRYARVHALLGMASETLLQEYADLNSEAARLVGGVITPVRARVQTAFIDKAAGDPNVTIPGKRLIARMQGAVSIGAVMRFDRVRLRVLPAGTSMYRQLK